MKDDGIQTTNKNLKKYMFRVDKQNEETIKQVEKELAKRYKNSFEEIDAQLSKLYASMGSTPSIQEARKYNRLKLLLESINAEYTKLTGYSIKSTEDTSISSYMSGSYGYRWSYDQATGVQISWPILPVNTIRESVYADTNGEDFQTRFKNWKTKDVIKIQQHITQGLATGQSYQKTSRKIREDVQASYDQAIRIVRTESARNYTNGNLQTHEDVIEAGVISSVQWVATLDQRTRSDHGQLDGQLADKDGLFHIHGLSTVGPGMFGDPAEDINCRCKIIDVIEGYEPEFRRIRDEGIVPYISFKDWATKQGWSEKQGWPKEILVKK